MLYYGICKIFPQQLKKCMNCCRKKQLFIFFILYLIFLIQNKRRCAQHSNVNKNVFYGNSSNFESYSTFQFEFKSFTVNWMLEKLYSLLNNILIREMDTGNDYGSTLIQVLSKMRRIDELRQAKIRSLIASCDEPGLNAIRYSIIYKIKLLAKKIKTDRTFLNDEQLLQTLVIIAKSYSKNDNTSKNILYAINKIKETNAELFTKYKKFIPYKPAFFSTKNDNKSNTISPSISHKNNMQINKILTNKLILSDPTCVGCIQLFQFNKFQNFYNTKSNNFYVLNLNQFKNQQELTISLCALANSPNGVIFVSDFVCQAQGYKFLGHHFTNTDLVEFRSYINKCLHYIGPSTIPDDYVNIQYIPIQHNEEQNSTQYGLGVKHVIRINIKQKYTRMVCFIDYKLNKDKKSDSLFFIMGKGKIQQLQPSEIYGYVHDDYKKQLKQLFIKGVHQQIKCVRPVKIQQLEENSQKQQNEKMVQPKPIGYKPSLTNANQIISKKPTPTKFKFSVLVVKSKGGDGKKQQKTFAEIEKQLVNQKILCRVQRILEGLEKHKFWLISYDCKGSFVESVINKYNKTAELNVTRPKKSIKIIDQEFFKEQKDVFLIKKLTQHGSSINQMYNTENETLNPDSKTPIILKFKHMNDAIYSFGLLLSLTRRIQFVKVQ